MARIVVLLTAAVFATAACANNASHGAASQGTSASGATAKVGSAAPSFDDPLVAGGSMSMAKLIGKPVMLDFFATWCPPCNAEAPEVETAYKTYGPKGVQIVGVDVQEGAAKAKQFVTDHQLTYPAVVDSGTLSDEYEINGMPVSVFIDRTGVVRKIVVGQMTQADIDADIQAVL
jgi:cytochrome c biogenesis protein CcmG, thiol:disulfide interchange protein DsbE